MMYKMVWDNGYYRRDEDFESYEDAKACAEEVLTEWMWEEIAGWDGLPTDQQKVEWNWMIRNCHTEIYECNPEAEKWTQCEGLSEDDLDRIGWAEIGNGYKPWVWRVTDEVC
jgi:hypothetical protein